MIPGGGKAQESRDYFIRKYVVVLIQCDIHMHTKPTSGHLDFAGEIADELSLLHGHALRHVCGHGQPPPQPGVEPTGSSTAATLVTVTAAAEGVPVLWALDWLAPLSPVATGWVATG